MLKKIALPFIIVLFLLVVNVQAQNIYKVQFYNFDNSSQPIVNGTSMTDFTNCEATLSSNLGMVASGGSATVSYFSPDNTLIGSGTDSDVDNIYCQSFGQSSTTTSLNNFYESKSTLIHSGTSANLTLTTDYTCDISSNTHTISIPRTATKDSFGNYQNMVYHVDTGTPVADQTQLDRIYPNNYNSCGIKSGLEPLSLTSFGATNQDNELALYYIFNSSNGNVNYNFSMGGITDFGFRCLQFNDNEGNLNVYLVKLKDNETITLHEQNTTCTYAGGAGWGYIINDFTGTLTGLELNTLYSFVLVYSHHDDAVIAQSTFKVPYNVEIEIGVFQGDYVCDEYSDCENGKQYRTCIDQTGTLPNIIQIRTCASVILENATLGFEEFTTTSDVLKCEPGWFFNCFYSITNISVDRPTNWSIGDPSYGGANFLQMSQEYATEGTRSLKMWQIPPKTGEVINNETCGNLTTSIIPQVSQGVSNDTFSVSHNVTFPATNMQVSFDVKKCSTQALQHSALIDEGLLFNTTLCNQKCYANECNVEPNGKYIFNIQDTVTLTSIFGSAQYSEAQLQTLSPTYGISDLGIIPGRTYNIVFSISNENPNDATGNCLYIDNVRYEVTAESIFSLVPGCISRCIGTTRIEATTTTTGSCFTTTQTFSPLCLDPETAEAVENNEDFCSDTSTLQTFNEKSGGREAVACSTGFVCDPFPVVSGNPGACITEAEAEAGATTTTDTETLTEELIEATSTRFFWAIAMILIFTGLSTFTVARLTKDGKAAFFVGAIVALILFIFFAGIFWIPIEYTAIVVLVIVLLVVYEIRKVVT